MSVPALAGGLGLVGAPAKAATIAVTTTADDNTGSCASSCSLRDAVAVAGVGDTINLGAPGTIALTNGPIVITKALTIHGSGPANVIDGGSLSRIFEVRSGKFVLTGMTLQNGKSKGDDAVGDTPGTKNGAGGALFVAAGATATVVDVTLSHNTAVGGNGGAANIGGAEHSGAGGGAGAAGGGAGTPGRPGNFGGGGSGAAYLGSHDPSGIGGFGGGGGGACDEGTGSPGGTGGGKGGNGGISNGIGGGGGGGAFGGAIFVDAAGTTVGTLILKNVSFTDNSATGGNGGFGYSGGAGGGGGGGLGSGVFNRGLLCVSSNVTFAAGSVMGGTGAGGGGSGGAGSGLETSPGVYNLGTQDCPATISALSGSATYSPSAQPVLLTASVLDAFGDPATAGIVTFSLLNGTTPIGTPVSTVVSQGQAIAYYVLPGGTAPGSYTLQAEYAAAAGNAASGVDKSQLVVVANAALLVKTTPLDAGDANCAAGGLEVAVGHDDGRNGGTANDGVLQAGEVENTSYVCNGENGADGETGEDGYNALVNTSTVPTGSAECVAGGLRIDAGVDNGGDGGVAGNGILEPGEVQSTKYVCNGTNGDDGTDGTNGKDGAPGKDGTDGKDGAPGANGKDGQGCASAPLSMLSLIGLLVARRRSKR